MTTLANLPTECCTSKDATCCQNAKRGRRQCSPSSDATSLEVLAPPARRRASAQPQAQVLQKLPKRPHNKGSSVKPSS